MFSNVTPSGFKKYEGTDVEKIQVPVQFDFQRHSFDGGTVRDGPHDAPHARRPQT